MFNNTWWRGLALVAIFALGWAGITVWIWDPEFRVRMVFLSLLVSAHLAITGWIHASNRARTRSEAREIMHRNGGKPHLYVADDQHSAH